MDPNSDGNENIVLAFSSGGYYLCLTGCTESIGNKNELNNLLNNVPASFEGALMRFQQGVYHSICSRNNNFTKGSQKGTTTV